MISTPIRAGDLRNQIVIEYLLTPRPRNPDGSEKRADESWLPLLIRAAKIDTMGGREFLAARSVNAALTHEITIRWAVGIKPNMRVRFNDPVEGSARTFDIKSIVNPNAEVRHCLLLHCSELVGRKAIS